MEWILVTAAFGGQNFHESGLRVVKQAEKFELFSEIILVNEENLYVYAPRTIDKYKEYLRTEIPGYGYFVWKPEIVNSILEMHPGCGVLYVDSGCEFHLNLISKMRLRLMLKKARRGSFLHVLNYPEVFHTKRKVFEALNIDLKNTLSPQFQATWFMLNNEVGREISRIWVEAALLDISMIDNSRFEEDLRFVNHRHDQSIFSCSIKLLGIKPKRHKPCVRPVTLWSKINCFFHPIWSARNRTGISIQKHPNIELPKATI